MWKPSCRHRFHDSRHRFHDSGASMSKVIAGLLFHSNSMAAILDLLKLRKCPKGAVPITDWNDKFKTYYKYIKPKGTI